MIDALRKRFEFAQFCTIHRRSLAAIQGWQLKQLRRLIQHAFLHVPMWRDIFTKAKLKEGHLEDLSDLEKIPLTNKATYVGKMVEEYVDIGRQFFHIWNSTSGTSGNPFSSLMASQYEDVLYRNFEAFRFLFWKGLRIEAISTTKIAHIERKSYRMEFRMDISYADFRDDPKKVFSQLSEFKPEVLIAVPSVLLDIARMSKTEKNLPRLAPQYVLSIGETLIPSVRSFVEEQLRSEVYDRYGLGEIAVVGVECSAHDGFHINSESLIVQVTNDVGKVLPEGEHGRVIITDLFNYNMPFIRYDTGDRGFLSFSPCTCGLRGPRLWLEGRDTLRLTFSGRPVYFHDFDALSVFMHQMLKYQVVKRGEQDLLLRVVPGPLWKESTLKDIQERVRASLGENIRVSIDIVSNIPNASSGKSNLLVDESVPPSR